MIQRIALIVAFLAAPVLAESQITTGKYRFTVITPNLIRIEHSPAKKFLDEPTYFAVDRKARFDAKIVKEAQRIVIDTGVIELECKDTGGPSMALSATIRHNGKTYEWKPGQKQTGNLGGTIQTLDQVTGPDSGRGEKPPRFQKFSADFERFSAGVHVSPSRLYITADADQGITSSCGGGNGKVC